MLISLMPGALAWPAAMIVWGPGYTSTLHRHHCVHLLMAVHGTLSIRGGARQHWLRCGAALVRPDAARDKTQVTVVLVEQSLDFIRRLASGILIIKKGTIIRSMRTEELDSIADQFLGMHSE